MYVPIVLSALVPSLKISKLAPLPEAPATFAVTLLNDPTSVLAEPDELIAVMAPEASTVDIVTVKSLVGVAPAKVLPKITNVCPG